MDPEGIGRVHGRVVLGWTREQRILRRRRAVRAQCPPLEVNPSSKCGTRSIVGLKSYARNRALARHPALHRCQPCFWEGRALPSQQSPGHSLFLQERQQILVDLVLVGVGQAVRRTRVDNQPGALDESGRLAA